MESVLTFLTFVALDIYCIWVKGHMYKILACVCLNIFGPWLLIEFLICYIGYILKKDFFLHACL